MPFLEDLSHLEYSQIFFSLFYVVYFIQDATPTEIEARLYDKFVIRITDIQVLLVEQGMNVSLKKLKSRSPKIEIMVTICHGIHLLLTFFNCLFQI